MPKCKECGETYEHHCDWICTVSAKKRGGGRIITPNCLPITCINADGTMLEHEHADHPGYLFPVEVKLCDALENTRYIQNEQSLGIPYPDDYVYEETHAAIYTDGHVLLTLFECSYTIWSLHDGECLGGFLDRGKWKSGLITSCAAIARNNPGRKYEKAK